MDGTEGFEPSNAETKTRCLTTWRRPNIIPKIGLLGSNQAETFVSTHQRRVPYQLGEGRS